MTPEEHAMSSSEMHEMNATTPMSARYLVVTNKMPFDIIVKVTDSANNSFVVGTFKGGGIVSLPFDLSKLTVPVNVITKKMQPGPCYFSACRFGATVWYTGARFQYVADPTNLSRAAYVVSSNGTWVIDGPVTSSIVANASGTISKCRADYIGGDDPPPPVVDGTPCE